MKNLRPAALLVSDLVCIAAVTAAVLWGYRQLGGNYPMKVLVLLWPLPLLIAVFNLFSRLYCGSFFYPGAGVNPVEELRRLTLSACGGYLLMFAYLSMTRTSEYMTRIGLGVSMIAAIFLLPVFRYAARGVLRRLHAGGIPVVLTGDRKTADMLRAELAKDSYYGFVPSGFIENPAEAVESARKAGSSYLIACLPAGKCKPFMHGWLEYFQHIMIVAGNDVFPILWAYPVNVGGCGGIEIGNRMKRRVFRMAKSAAEFCVAAAALLCILPVGIVLGILVKLTSRGPVFYHAGRLGLNGRKITVLKFRTMYRDADKKLADLLASDPALAAEWKEKFKLDNDPRITPFGAFLRKTSLDELPQFWNVLKGEMAVIGPRPIVEKEVAYYGDNYPVFASVKPGITGLWQVSGRSETTYERRIALDMYYICNWSVWLDYWIFLRTIREVLLRKGAK